jgi:hypothetical protein
MRETRKVVDLPKQIKSVDGGVGMAECARRRNAE